MSNILRWKDRDRMLGKVRRVLSGHSREADVRYHSKLIEDATDWRNYLVKQGAGKLFTDPADKLVEVSKKLDPADDNFHRKAELVRHKLETQAGFIDFAFREPPIVPTHPPQAVGTIEEQIRRSRDPNKQGEIDTDDVLSYAKIRLFGKRLARTAIHKHFEEVELTNVASALIEAGKQPKPLKATATPRNLKTTGTGPRLETVPVVVTAVGGSGDYVFAWTSDNEDAEASDPDASTTTFILNNPREEQTDVSFTCVVTDRNDPILSYSVTVTATFINRMDEPGPAKDSTSSPVRRGRARRSSQG
jgi:hypothetical protein